MFLLWRDAPDLSGADLARRAAEPPEIKMGGHSGDGRGHWSDVRGCRIRRYVCCPATRCNPTGRSPVKEKSSAVSQDG